jgi:hypothetical protein
MVSSVLAPEVVECYFDEAFDPQLPAMRLRWPARAAGRRERLWELPEGLTFTGPAPERFGIHIRRTDADAYRVRLLWDRTCLTWPSLSRTQLLASSLTGLLAALGTDLWCLLDQPLAAPRPPRPRAA